MAGSEAEARRRAELAVLAQSGLFVPSFYRAQRGVADGAVADADALADWHDGGWRLGLGPNPYFDPAWYRARHADVAAADTDPLLHYACYGEAEGRWPIGWFDPAWYRTRYQVPAGQHALAHFLAHRAEGMSPIPEFDAAWYLATYPDVAAAGMDPMEHYLVRGFQEGRDPAPGFDTRFYRWRYLADAPDTVPLLHYLARPDRARVPTRLAPEMVTAAREVARFTARGPEFEEKCADPVAATRALLLAFYLPQFHPIPENDAFWGAGFTEWTNLARGQPRFAGHYQPRIPRDLGHYRADQRATLAAQAKLARAAGIGGFVFYHYRFGQRLVLERPLGALRADPSIALPFCLMWANENWTRAWDGAEADVLLAQSYEPADEAALLDDFLSAFADPRYVRLGGRPLLMVYRPRSIPGGAARIAAWRAVFAAAGENPLLVMAQSFGAEDPRPLGFDAAVGFPPHLVVDRAALINWRLDLLDPEFSGHVYEYAEVARLALAGPDPAYPRIPTVVPSWDNDCRRQGRGLVLHGASPARYQAWLEAAIAAATRAPLLGTPVVCINAWNEWAEGAYLEPDLHFGAAYLNATARAVRATPAPARLLLVLHDAFPAGAQLLMLHLARGLRDGHGLVADLALCGGGALLSELSEAARLHRVADPAELAGLAARLGAQGCRAALVGSAAVAWAVPVLQGAGWRVTQMVHEMPQLLAARGLIAPLAEALERAAVSVFPAAAVRDAVAGALGRSLTRAVLLAQGLYQPLKRSPALGAAFRARHAIAPGARLVLGLGHADRRKGFDLFLDAAELAGGLGVVFVWCGTADPDLQAERAEQMRRLEAAGWLRRLGFQPDPAPALNAADLLALTSREDPYPSVALEALSLGVPVLGFAGAGGIAPLLRGAAGRALPMADVAALVAAIADPPARARHSLLPAPHRMDDYARALLRLALPDPAVAVVVLSFRQQAQIGSRLASVFAQTRPVDRVTLIDDASPDGTVSAARKAARAAGRTLAVRVARRNSGSPFGRWAAAVESSDAPLLWLTEGDDEAEPDLLAALLPAFADPAMVMAFCDSRAIGPDGAPSPIRYAESYAQAGLGTVLGADACFEAPDFAAQALSARNLLFNVGAILFRRDALAEALGRIGPGLTRWQVAGDWLVYWTLLRQGGLVWHVARPLNRHRRAADTASARLDKRAHLAEIRAMHARIRADLAAESGGDPGLLAAQAAALADAARSLGVALEDDASRARDGAFEPERVNPP